MKLETISLVGWLLQIYLLFAQIESIEGQERSAPRFIDPSQPVTKYVAKGQKINLTCQASGKPAPRYNWLRNGEDIGAQSIEINKLSGTMILTVQQADDAAEYQCTAEVTVQRSDRGYQFAKALSPIVTVKIMQTELDPIEDGLNKKIVTSTHGEFTSLTLNCQYYLNSSLVVPKYIFYWYIGINQLSFTQDTRRYIDNKGHLHFAYLKVADSKANAPYRCSLKFPDKIQTLQGTRLTVTANKTRFVDSKPTLLYKTDSNETKFQLYQDAELECVFGGYDRTNKEPKIEWELDDLPIRISGSRSKYSITHGNHRLTIRNVTEADEHIYTCVASTFKGELRVDVELDVVSPPIFDSREKKVDDKVVLESQNATFNCDARSLEGEEEVGDPTFLINAHQYVEESHLLKTTKSVTVLNTKKSRDFLCVQCNVSNNYGTTWANGCLRVIIGTQVSRSPPKLQSIEFGDDVELTAEWTIDPGIDVTATWTFNGIRYPYREFPFSETEEGRLFVDTATLEEEEYRSLEGTYILTLTHPHQSVEMSTKVEVHPFHPGGTFQPELPVLMLFMFISPIVFICGTVSYIMYQKYAYNRGQREFEIILDDDFRKPGDKNKDAEENSRLKSIFNIRALSQLFTAASRKTDTEKKSSSYPEESKNLSSGSGSQPSDAKTSLPIISVSESS